MTIYFQIDTKYIQFVCYNKNIKRKIKLYVDDFLIGTAKFLLRNLTLLCL